MTSGLTINSRPARYLSASVLLPGPFGPARTQSCGTFQIPDDGFYTCLEIEINKLTAAVGILLHNMACIGRIPVVDWASSGQVLLRCFPGIIIQVILELFPELTLLL